MRKALIGTLSALALATAAFVVYSRPRHPALIAVRPVTDSMLLAADSGGDWLTYGRSFANQRFAPFTQIDRETVRHLRPLWHQGTRRLIKSYLRTESTPVVADGMLIYTDPGMRVAEPGNHVIAVTCAPAARSGRGTTTRAAPRCAAGWSTAAWRSTATRCTWARWTRIWSRWTAAAARWSGIARSRTRSRTRATPSRWPRSPPAGRSSSERAAASSGSAASWTHTIPRPAGGSGASTRSLRPKRAAGGAGCRSRPLKAPAPARHSGGAPRQRGIRRYLEARRRPGMDHAGLRPRPRAHLPRHRQPVGRGRPHSAGGQSLHQLSRRARPGQRQASLVLPDGAARRVGLRPGEPASAAGRSRTAAQPSRPLHRPARRAGCTSWTAVPASCSGDRSRSCRSSTSLRRPPRRACASRPGRGAGATGRPRRTRRRRARSTCSAATSRCSFKIDSAATAAAGARKPSAPPHVMATFTEFKNDGRFGTFTAVDAATGRIRWQHKVKSPLMVGGALATAERARLLHRAPLT